MSKKIKNKINIRRIYEIPAKRGGTRVLVDRLWPRGISKEKAKVDFWLKEIAPSDSLRKWFGHKEERWEEFKKRYHKELKNKKELIEQIKLAEKKGTVTLLFAAKDTERNNALVLKDLLSK